MKQQNEDSSKETTTESTAAESTGEIKIGRVNNSPHGDKSFATTVVVMDGDTIVGASIDEFQFLGDDATGYQTLTVLLVKAIQKARY